MSDEELELTPEERALVTGMREQRIDPKAAAAKIAGTDKGGEKNATPADADAVANKAASVAEARVEARLAQQARTLEFKRVVGDAIKSTPYANPVDEKQIAETAAAEVNKLPDVRKMQPEQLQEALKTATKNEVKRREDVRKATEAEEKKAEAEARLKAGASGVGDKTGGATKGYAPAPNDESLPIPEFGSGGQNNWPLNDEQVESAARKVAINKLQKRDKAGASA